MIMCYMFLKLLLLCLFCFMFFEKKYSGLFLYVYCGLLLLCLMIV